MLSLPRALACVTALAAAAATPLARAGTALRAAVVQEDIAPWIGVPLAGFGGDRRLPLPVLLGLYPYAFWLKPSVGQLDPIRVKVLLLEQGGARLAFVALDVVGVSRDMRDEIVHRSGFGSDELIVSATHTHSGPGAVEKSPLFEVTVADRIDYAVYEAFMGHITSAIAAAQAGLVDAQLSAYSFAAPGLQRNRRDPAGALDPLANVLLVRTTGGEWLGAMIGFAIHGTAFGDDNLSFSADVPGAIAESMGVMIGLHNTPPNIVPVLFVNGAEGDVSPISGGAAGIASIASQFTLKAQSAFATAAPVSEGFSVKSRDVDLGTSFAYLEPWKTEPGLAWAALLPGVGLALDSWMSDTTRIWSIKLGGLTFLTWPGEPTAELGLAARGLCSASHAAQVWNMALTNDHLGYFVTPEEFAAGGYEARSSRFGPHAGRKLLKEHCQLMNAH